MSKTQCHKKKNWVSTIYKLVLKYYIAKPPTLCRDEKIDIKVKSLKSLWRDEEGIWNLDGKGNSQNHNAISPKFALFSRLPKETLKVRDAIVFHK